MLSLSLNTALTVLLIACILMAVQLIILTVEISALRRDVLTLLRTTSALNHAVNPWAGEDEPTEPGYPPRAKRPLRWGWFPRVQPPKGKRQRPD
jgi:hypothetical protein